MGDWRKSSYSASQQACVEIGRGVGIRDSKAAGHLPVSALAWSAFLVAVKSGIAGERS
jgi:hypothetical protein